MGSKRCCFPIRDGQGTPDVVAAPVVRGEGHVRDCVFVPGGMGLLGTSQQLIAGDGEGPPILKRVRDLWWGRGTISIRQFRHFVEATGSQTLAEREGWSFVFYSHIPGDARSTMGVDGLEWWRKVEGANWAFPVGPAGPLQDDDMPATHISHSDARAFAQWAGGRLPREVEWEHAARGGLGDVRYPWGDAEPNDTDFLPCNIWQGEFPGLDTGADGFSGPAPVLSFAPNNYGLHNMVGNVWEWTADPFRLRSAKTWAREVNLKSRALKLLKGGSFLCHSSYCYRYRIAARTGNTPDSTSAHTGFRVVYERPPSN